MDKELLKRWRELLKPLFPPSTYIRIRTDKSVIMAVDWRLKNMTGEPSRFSRLIKIIIPEGVMQQYQQLNESKRTHADQKLIDFIRCRLKQFDPYHDSPPGSIPPFEEWLIESHIIIQ
jgi:hypothetical protein